jgi:molybdopterin molybdotransferase
VARRPSVAILVNGEELARPGQTPLPWQISDSAGPGLAGLIEAWGGCPHRLPQVGDDSAAITGAVAGAAADLIVTIGGASVGDHDLVKPALAMLGLRLLVETVNVRPGKPTWFGLLADGRRVLGLPGNPASAFACAQLFLRPLILAMLGAEPQPRLEAAVLQADLDANGARETWLRAEFVRCDAGHAEVRAFGQQDSSLIGVFARAGALLPRAQGAPALKAGVVVPILRLDRPS